MTPSSPSNLDVAALVRTVRSAEQWLDHANSFRVRLADAWTTMDPWVEGSRPDPSGTIEIGFDRHRLNTRRETPAGRETVSVRVWDGQRATSYARFPVPQQLSVIDGRPVVGDAVYCLLGDAPAKVAMFFLADLAWGRAGPHDYWWVPAEHQLGNNAFGEPGDYRSHGETTFRGKRCHALGWSGRFRTYYAGVDDHRLYGISKMELDPADVPNLEAVAREYAAELGDAAPADAQIEDWVGSLPEDQRKSFMRGLFDRFWPLARPRSLFWFGDHREVSPGRWFPMSQGYDSWDIQNARPGDPPRSTRSQRVLEVVVDEPLPEAWFSRDWKPGVPVNDFSAEPPWTEGSICCGDEPDDTGDAGV